MAERQEANLSSPKTPAGATPVDPKQNGRPSSTKQGLHWFAECGTSPDVNDESPRRPARYAGPRWLSDDFENELSSDEGKDGQQLGREERLKLLRERQNEEKQRKLDELKQQALAAQKFREQKEEERRRRLEELRVRDTDRRHQVEERKRQIWEAERDRREAILRKNQEREARIESKRKNERSSIVFAFGSSTPRMLEPGDTGSAYWATRRATSTSNVMTLSLSAAPGPLTRRSSERELDGSKKRATSAGGIERKPQDCSRMSSSIYEVFQWGASPPSSPTSQKPLNPIFKMELGGEVRRRKTDLTPTVPEREGTPPPSARAKGKPGVRSGEITPSRPQSSLSQHSVSSQLSAASMTASMRARTPRRPRPVSIAVTGVSSPGSDRGAKSPNLTSIEKPPIPKVHSTKKPASKTETPPKKSSEKPKSSKSSASTTPKGTPLQSPMVESLESNLDEPGGPEDKGGEGSPGERSLASPEPGASGKSTPPRAASPLPVPVQQTITPAKLIQQQPPQPELPGTPKSQLLENGAEPTETDMTASMIARSRITTEEEAKAALAERRRLAREQAEREAELERQRLEAERLAEEERIRKEEEEQRRMEEEQLRLLEEARKSEELRLQQAIEEVKKREEEEKQRREEEQKQKLEREEAEKKAKEEAEKQRIEMEIRLKKEEEDRQARRKRVEAIMLRTRGRGSTASATTPSKDGEESEENSPPEEAKKTNEHDEFLNSERSHSDANTIQLVENNNKHNGHHNGSIDPVSENNVTNSLLDLSPPGEILELPTGNGKLPETPPPFIESNQSHPVNDLLS